MKRKHLYVNSISHFLVDFVCVASLFSFRDRSDPGQFVVAVTVYNIFAFLMQCLVGLLIDKTHRLQMTAGISCIISGAAALLPLPLITKAVAVGVGNCFFHVSAGADTLRHSGGKAGSLGIFVAPGAFGVTLGRLYPETSAVFSMLLVAFGLLHFFASQTSDPKHAGAYQKPDFDKDPKPFPTHTVDRITLTGKPSIVGEARFASRDDMNAFTYAAAVLLTAAIAVRALGGTAVSFSWIAGASDLIILTGAVFIGKVLGGFIYDKFAAVVSACVSILPASFLIAFGAHSMPLSLVGQIAINLTMPVTLYLLYKLMPETPGFAFGLAATALLPGTFLGQIVLLAEMPQYVQNLLILVTMLFGFVSILISDKIICLTMTRTRRDSL